MQTVERACDAARTTGSADNASGCRSPRAAAFELATSVDQTLLFSLRENAIAKEPGLSYSQRTLPPCSFASIKSRTSGSVPALDISANSAPSTTPALAAG